VGRLGRAQILEAFEALADELGASGPPIDLYVVRGAALVLLYNARDSTKDVDAFTLAMKLSAWRDDIDIEDARLLLARLAGSKAAVWAQVEPHLVPGDELKAQYAFEDLWEASRGPV
jgi:hypothetical protein